MRVVSFEEILRKGQEIQAAGEAGRKAAATEQAATRTAADEFRQNLRQFGSWFAQEASSRGVPTVPQSGVLLRGAVTWGRGRHVPTVPAERVRLAVHA